MKKKQEIIYNYGYAVSKKTNDTDFLKFSFQGKTNQPNIIFSKNNISKNFVSSNLFIFGKKQNEKYDGVLVIENLPTTNENKKIYLSFPLKTNENIQEATTIDEMIETPKYKDIEIELDKILPETDNEVILHENKELIYIHFNSPILIKNLLSNFSENKLFSFSQENGKEVKTEKIIAKKSKDNKIPETTTEGFSGIEQWMECDNVELNDETNIATYTVPLKQDNTIFMQWFILTMHFILFIFIIGVFYFFLPIIYSFIVVRSFFNVKVVNDRIYNITAIELLFSFLLLIPSFILILYSFFTFKTEMKDDDRQQFYNKMTAGVYMSLIWLLSYVVIQYNKIIKSKTLLGFDGNNIPYYDFEEHPFKFRFYVEGVVNILQSVHNFSQSFSENGI